ncbi:MAG: sugar phosphate nucleotidyltransferase, partial [Dictyoglomus sp.]
MENFKVIVLAAGQGKRMRTELPKVLHPLYDTTILEYLLTTIRETFGENYFLVISPKIKNYLSQVSENNIVLQEVPLGTGDAVRKVEPLLGDYDGDVLVLPGDVPLIKKETLNSLCLTHRKENNVCTIVTAVMENPQGYGRIVRDLKGDIVKIVEEKDASEEERKIREINTSIYAFKWLNLKEALCLLNNNNVQKEFYLTDVVSIFARNKLKIGAFPVDLEEVLGANTQEELSYIRKILKRNINKNNMDKGV